jgi:hypothetical protein
MYPLLVLTFTLALWGLVAGAQDGQARGWIMYAAAGAAMAWSHAVGIYYAAVLAALALAIPREDGQRWSWRPWLAAGAALVALFAPWLPVAVATTRDTVADFWIPHPGLEPPFFTTVYQFTVSPIVSPAEVLRSHLGLDSGALLGTWVWMVVILAVLAFAIALGQPKRRWTVRLLVLAYLAPIGLFTVLSLVVRPILLPRILLPVVVPLVLLLAVGVEAVPRPRWRAAVGGGLALALLLGSAYGLRYDVGFTEDGERPPTTCRPRRRPATSCSSSPAAWHRRRGRAPRLASSRQWRCSSFGTMTQAAYRACRGSRRPAWVTGALPASSRPASIGRCGNMVRTAACG